MDKEEQLRIKLKGIMEYYVKEYFNFYRDKYKEELHKMNPGIMDPEILDIGIDQYIDAVIDESSEKFHSICHLMLNTLTSGRELLVREFEVLFIDLIKRTILKDVKDEKAEVLQPISIIIEDPNVKSTEEK